MPAPIQVHDLVAIKESEIERYIEQLTREGKMKHIQRWNTYYNTIFTVDSLQDTMATLIDPYGSMLRISIDALELISG